METLRGLLALLCAVAVGAQLENQVTTFAGEFAGLSEKMLSDMISDMHVK